MIKASTHDEYIAATLDRFRPTLSDFRHQIAALLPQAEEVISYSMPGFRLGKKVVAGYAAFNHHCSFFPHSGATLNPFRAEFDALGMTYAKSGLHFTPELPIPHDLLVRMLATRLAEVGLDPSLLRLPG